MCIDDGEVDEHVDCDWACFMLHDEEVWQCNLSCNSRVRSHRFIDARSGSMKPCYGVYQRWREREENEQ